MRSIPRLVTESAMNGSPAFETTHADRGEEMRLAFQSDLNAALVVLSGRQEKRPVDQRISVEDGQRMAAHDAGDAVHFVAGEGGQDEDSGLVVPDAAFVFHLERGNYILVT